MNFLKEMISNKNFFKERFNSKLLFFLIILYSVITLLDAITMLFILDGESNPLYLLTGSALTLWIFKGIGIALMFYVYFNNKYSSRIWYFGFVYLLTIGSLMTGFGVYSNVLGMIQPDIVTTASELTVKQKMNYYSFFIGLFMILPLFISLVAFKIYDYTEEKIVYRRNKKIKND